MSRRLGCLRCARPARPFSNYCEACWEALLLPIRRPAPVDWWAVLGLALCLASAALVFVVFYSIAALAAGGL